MLAVIGLVYGFMGARAEAADAAEFTPNMALKYLKEAVEKQMPYGYYLEDEDYETKDEEFYMKRNDDIYLLGTSTEQIRGGVAYCFEFVAYRLFGARAIVFADGAVEFDFYVDDSSYDDYLYLFPFLEK